MFCISFFNLTIFTAYLTFNNILFYIACCIVLHYIVLHVYSNILQCDVKWLNYMCQMLTLEQCQI